MRLIRGAAEFLGRHRGVAGIGLLGVVLAVWAMSGFYTVGVSESGALLRMGKLVDDAVEPGWGLALGPIYRVERAPTGEVQSLEIRGDQLPELSLLTGDENVIDVRLVAQYKITGLGRYLFGVDDASALLAQAVRAGLVERVAGMQIDDVLTAGKAEIENEVRRHAQEAMDRYDAGITVVSLNLQSVSPPVEAATAFRSVSDARAEAARLINDAESERGRTVSLARGEAGRLLSEANAAAKARTESARGAAQRFRSVLARNRAIPGQARNDLFLDMVRTVLPRARVVLLAPGQKPDIEVNLTQPRPAPAEEAPLRVPSSGLFGLTPREDRNDGGR
ncbi:hypothetical protein ABI59_06785 [Acidobacteria bacterium Mor1]|nr:hypothetical protein ABI59_06785 [Acidobacteria bacterium Mor1]